MPVVAVGKGNMMGKEGTLVGGKIMQGAIRQPIGSRENRKTGPPVAQSAPSHTSIMLARSIIKCAHLPTRKSSGCIWVCTASSFMSTVMSTVGRGVVPFKPE